MVYVHERGAWEFTVCVETALSRKVEVNEQCGNTLFHQEKSVEKNTWKDRCWQKLLIEKSKYWHNQLRKGFW